MTPPKPATDGQCYPHNFKAAWADDDKGGMIFCSWCGEIRPLRPTDIGAPPEEALSVTFNPFSPNERRG